MALLRLSDFLDEYEANVVAPSSTRPIRDAPQTPAWSRCLDSRMVQARQCFIGLFRPQAHFNHRKGRVPETCNRFIEASAGAMDAIEYSLEQGSKLGVVLE